MAQEFEIVTNPRFRNLHVFLVNIHARMPHIHRELEIGFVLSGHISLRANGRTLELGLFDGYMINPLEPHAFFDGRQDTVILAIQVSPRLFESFFTVSPLLRFRHCTCLREAIADADAYADLMAQCFRLARLYIAGIQGQEYDCFAIITNLIAELRRHLEAEDIPMEAWQPIQRRMERFLAILDHIDESFHHKLLLEDISAREGLSMPYLSHLFRDTLGMSFQEYLKRKRFEYARPLILGTRRSLLDISLESGFSDTRYMVALFQEEFGCSPREYRQRHGEAKSPSQSDVRDAQRLMEKSEALQLLTDMISRSTRSFMDGCANCP